MLGNASSSHRDLHFPGQKSGCAAAVNYSHRFSTRYAKLSTRSGGGGGRGWSLGQPRRWKEVARQ